MPATRARTCTSREPSVRATASKVTGTSRAAACSTATGTAAGAASWAAFFSCWRAPLSLHAARTTLSRTIQCFMVNAP